MPLSFEEFKKARKRGMSLGELKKGQYEPDVSAPGITQPAVQKRPSFLRQVGETAQKVTGGFHRGVGKGLVSTATGLASLQERGAKALGRLFLPKSQEQRFGVEAPETTFAERKVPERFRKPEGLEEKTGFMAEQIAEFIVPGSLSTKAGALVKGTGTASKLGRLGVRAATEAGLSGAQTAIQRGKFDDKAKVNAIIGAAFPFLQAGVAATGKKVFKTVIRPQTADVKDGFTVDALTKHKLGGNLKTIFEKSSHKLNELGNRLRRTLKGSDETVDLLKVFNQTQGDIAKQSKGKLFGNIKQSKGVLKQLKGEIDEVGQSVDLYMATNIKRGAGTKTAWVETPYGSISPDATATQQVYKSFYKNLKEAIEKKAPGTIKKINQEMSEIIPVRNAVIRRIPAEARRNVLDLRESLAVYAAMYNPWMLSILGATRLMRSGSFANILIKASESAIPRGIFPMISKGTEAIDKGMNRVPQQPKSMFPLNQ